MDLSITEVPIWVSLLFIISFSTLPVLLIANTVKSVFKSEKIKGGLDIRQKIILFYWIYLAIIALASLSGFFEKNVLPPRIILVAVIPLFFFYIMYVQSREWFKLVIKHIRLDQLITIHLFRFIGVFFFLVYYYGALPKAFAFIGGAGDILTAILAIPVLIALRRNMKYSKHFVWIWNIIGLIDIISVLVTAIVITRMAIENNERGVEQFASFPFSWIPAFAPATIIFLHLLIFRKLKELKP